MLAMRTLFMASRVSKPRKIGPQTGISVEPCAGTRLSPVTNASTRDFENVPPLRGAMAVRSVPGDEIVVSHTANAHEQVDVAVRDAFDAARRQLQDHARKQRGDVKLHRPVR
jgi:hypothetical protein